MTAAQVVPRRGEMILIRRPGGPDIRMRFDRLDILMPGAEPGWLWLEGEVVEGLRGGWQTLYARLVGPGVYEMTGVRSARV